MTELKKAERIHDILIDKFGGIKGIRDKGALESALNRPYATFGKEELYPTYAHKAAALLESIVVNHPFIDGNKRTGYVLMRLLLMKEGRDIHAEQDDKYALVMGVSKGDFKFDHIKNWVEQRIVPYKK